MKNTQCPISDDTIRVKNDSRFFTEKITKIE